MQALSMMVAISGSRCELLHSCLAPPYRVSSSHESLKESRRSNGLYVSLVKNENLRLAGLTGTNISKKNLRKSIHQGYTPSVAGSCRSVTGPELGIPLGKSLAILDPKGRLGKRNQVRIARSRVKCSANGVAGEAQKEESGSLCCGVKQSGPIERIVSLKDGWALGTGDVNEQGSYGKYNVPRGGVLRNETSKSEYQKIQDLRFSGDISEGDSGPQVLDLQRALYWFGYLRKRAELTAYFGPETKRALQQFQIAYGVSGTGAWGSSSRQALWKLLSEESSSLSEGNSVYSDVRQLGSPLANEVNVGGTDVGIRVSELINNMSAHGQDFMSTLSSAPYWKPLPTNVPRNAAMFGLLVGMLAALFGLGYSLVGMIDEQHGQPVRRRVLRAHWRDDLSGTTFAKPKRHLDVFPDLDLAVVGEEDFKYRLRSKSRSSLTNGTGRTDRLILYGGQVFTGDEESSPVYPFMNGPASHHASQKTASQGPSRARASSIHVQTPTGQVSQRPASNGSPSGYLEENSQESQLSPERISNVYIRGENPSITRADSDALGSTSSGSVQNSSPGSTDRPKWSNPMEQPNEKQPNFVRALLSALFTPKGLRNSVGLKKHERQRIGSSSTQVDALSSEKQAHFDSETESKMSRMERSPKSGGNYIWQDKDEENFKDRVEELRKAVQATEKNRQAAMRALAEERQRSLELQVKISRQKETAAALEEEVRVLKESHETLLASLRKKYSSSVAARAAAALLYQNWDTNYEEGSPQTVSY